MEKMLFIYLYLGYYIHDVVLTRIFCNRCFLYGCKLLILGSLGGLGSVFVCNFMESVAFLILMFRWILFCNILSFGSLGGDGVYSLIDNDWLGDGWMTKISGSAWNDFTTFWIGAFLFLARSKLSGFPPVMVLIPKSFPCKSVFEKLLYVPYVNSLDVFCQLFTSPSFP